VPIFLVLCIVAATIIYPLIFLIISAVRTNEDYLQNPFGLPGEVTLQNFLVLINSYGVGRAFGNSFFVVVTALVVTLIVATLAGFSLAKYPVPGARYVTAAFVSVMLVPGPVLIIPIYLLLSRLGLVGEFPGLILVYIATSLPFSVFFLSVAFRGIPDEVIEAAKIDGAGFIRTIFSIVLPMGSSGIATLAVLQFLSMWNELIFAFILLPDDTKTLLTPALAQIGDRYVNDQPLVSAGLLISAALPMLLLAFASKYILQGLQVGVSR
jgi:ABC-type glycerol-3-phosphate transport system permease component